MAKIKKMNHVGIVVPDIDQALLFWEKGLGIKLQCIKDIPAQESRVAFFPLGDSEIELVQPISTTTGVYRFLSNRGPGLHHLCFEVDDIIEFSVRMRDLGIQMINETPLNLDDRLVLFIHPKSAGGVLVELFQDI